MIKAKTYEEIMRDMIKSLEADMFGRDPRRQLLNLLAKLDIKSARGFGTSLQVEGLDAILKQATFNMGDLKLWNSSKVTKL